MSEATPMTADTAARLTEALEAYERAGRHADAAGTPAALDALDFEQERFRAMLHLNAGALIDAAQTLAAIQAALPQEPDATKPPEQRVRELVEENQKLRKLWYEDADHLIGILRESRDSDITMAELWRSELRELLEPAATVAATKALEKGGAPSGGQHPGEIGVTWERKRPTSVTDDATPTEPRGQEDA